MSWITSVFESILKFFCSFTGSYAISIALLTLLIKLILHPFTVKQFEMTEKMKMVQPLMKEIQEKYKDDPQQMNMRVAEIYRDYKINVFGGCLPMILPLPFLVIMYRVFLNTAFTEQLAAAGVNIGFLWISNFAVPDTLRILPILSGLTTYFTFSQSQAQADPSQKTMTYLMPLMFVFITWSLPSGAAFYWVVSNIIGIIQNFLVKKQVDARLKRSAK